jgi:hypothetical protein
MSAPLATDEADAVSVPWLGPGVAADAAVAGATPTAAASSTPAARVTSFQQLANRGIFRMNQQLQTHRQRRGTGR